MLSILIIEDEAPAAKRLWKVISELMPTAHLLATIDSVEGSVDWLQKHPAPDLILSDIQLSDGVSFHIFRQVNITTPIIFITAFDQYAIDAFKVNSIDYLLKPVKKTDLEAALEKFNKTRQAQQPLDIEKLIQSYSPATASYKKRFVVKYGEHLSTVNVADVAYCYTEDKINFLVNNEGRRFVIDHNLDALESVLDPVQFFRINRQFIISIKAIAEMFSYSKSRVRIVLQPPCKHETIVSAARSAEFKHWLDDSIA